jgi:hypothetical protein
MFERSDEPRTVEELLHAQRYTPEELADLTGVGLDVIRRAIYDGFLPARMVEDDIIDITRADALRWLNERSGEPS